MKKENKIWVYAAGVFDCLHYGHVRYLEAAKKLGDVLVVGLLDDDAVARYKPRKPLIPYEQRWEVIKALRCVDYIVRQNDTDPTQTLEELLEVHKWTFDILCRGDDYQGHPPGGDFILQHGGVVERIPYCHEISSTRIKEHLASGGIL